MFRVSPILPTQKSLWCYRGLRITSYSGMILIRYEGCGKFREHRSGVWVARGAAEIRFPTELRTVMRDIHCNPGHRYVQTLVFDIRFIFYTNIRVRAFTLVTQASTDNVESKCSFSEFLQDRNEHWIQNCLFFRSWLQSRISKPSEV